MKLGVQRRVKLRGRLPIIGAMPERNRLALAFALPVGGLFFSIRAVDFGARQGCLNRNKRALRYAVFSPSAGRLFPDSGEEICEVMYLHGEELHEVDNLSCS